MDARRISPAAPVQTESRVLPEPDDRRPQEAHPDPDPAPRAHPLVEEEDGRKDGPDRRGLDEHRGGARGDSHLTVVQREAVEGEPQEPQEEDQGKIARRREAHAREEGKDHEGGGCGE